MGKIISVLGLVLYFLLNNYKCSIKVYFPITCDPIQNCSKSSHAIRKVTCKKCYKSSSFCTPLCTGKKWHRGKQPLKTAHNAWVLWMGNRFLPFGSPARKISIIRCKCAANSVRKTPEQCVGIWRMVNMSTSRWCLIPWTDESHFQNAFPPLFPKDESACGMFCNWCFAVI